MTDLLMIDPKFISLELDKLGAPESFGGGHNYKSGFGHRIDNVLKVARDWVGAVGDEFRKKYPIVENPTSKAIKSDEKEEERDLITMGEAVTEFGLTDDQLGDLEEKLGSSSDSQEVFDLGKVKAILEAMDISTD